MESKSLIGFLEWLASKQGWGRVVFCLRGWQPRILPVCLEASLPLLYISLAYQKKNNNNKVAFQTPYCLLPSQIEPYSTVDSQPKNYEVESSQEISSTNKQPFSDMLKWLNSQAPSTIAIYPLCQFYDSQPSFQYNLE